MSKSSEGRSSALPVQDPTDTANFQARFLAEEDQPAAAGCPPLTRAGSVYIQDQLGTSRGGMGATRTDLDPSPAPRWDAAERQLWLGDRLVRGFPRHSAQTGVLAEFQRLGWPAGPVSLPLMPEPGDSLADIRRRVRETVKNLNRGLPPGTLRFRAARGRVWCELAGAATGTG